MGKKGEATQTLCYVKDPQYAWVPAVLDKQEGDKAYVKIPQYKDEQSISSDGGRGARDHVEKVVNLKDYQHKVLPLQNVNKSGVLDEYPDMVKLPYLHEVCGIVAAVCRCSEKSSARHSHCLSRRRRFCTT